jgi:hypothetical protein
MQRNLFALIGGLILLSLCGCVTAMLTEQAANQAAPPTLENFAFDISTPGSDVGTLIIQTRQPSYQLAVERYAIKIDTNAPLVVSKQSDVTIKLNAGAHALKLYATSSNPAESDQITFGMSNKKDIVITKDQKLKLKYTGPYRLLGSGRVKDIK